MWTVGWHLCRGSGQLGQAAQAVAVPLWVGVQEGQAVLSEALTSLQAGHLHLFIYSANTTNTKVSSLCWAILETGGTEMMLGNCLQKQGGVKYSDRDHAV